MFRSYARGPWPVNAPFVLLNCLPLDVVSMRSARLITLGTSAVRSYGHAPWRFRCTPVNGHAQHFTCQMHKHIIPTCRDDMLVAILLLACDCVGEDALACLFRGIDGQLGDVYVGWLLKHLDDDKRDLLCL